MWEIFSERLFLLSRALFILSVVVLPSETALLYIIYAGLREQPCLCLLDPEGAGVSSDSSSVTRHLATSGNSFSTLESSCSLLNNSGKLRPGP